jgi:hypothetical protein
MQRNDYLLRFQEALSKAFAAGSPSVRNAYLDLANFYHERLGDEAPPCPCNENCRATSSRARLG